MFRVQQKNSTTGNLIGNIITNSLYQICHHNLIITGSVKSEFKRKGLTYSNMSIDIYYEYKCVSKRQSKNSATSHYLSYLKNTL